MPESSEVGPEEGRSNTSASVKDRGTTGSKSSKLRGHGNRKKIDPLEEKVKEQSRKIQQLQELVDRKKAENLRRFDEIKRQTTNAIIATLAQKGNAVTL